MDPYFERLRKRHDRRTSMELVAIWAGAGGALFLFWAITEWIW